MVMACIKTQFRDNGLIEGSATSDMPPVDYNLANNMKSCPFTVADASTMQTVNLNPDEVQLVVNDTTPPTPVPPFSSTPMQCPTGSPSTCTVQPYPLTITVTDSSGNVITVVPTTPLEPRSHYGVYTGPDQPFHIEPIPDDVPLSFYNPLPIDLQIETLVPETTDPPVLVASDEFVHFDTTPSVIQITGFEILESIQLDPATRFVAVVDDSSSAASKTQVALRVVGFNLFGEPLEPLVVTANEAEAGMPERFMLSQNYPNPFNPVTRIEYDLAESVLVHLAVYDVTGRLVQTLVEQRQAPGRYTVRWKRAR